MSTPITAQMVNELRGATGAGLLDCKKALTEANGNVADATTILRKKLGRHNKDLIQTVQNIGYRFKKAVA